MQTIWLATDRTGACSTYAYTAKPDYDFGDFLSTERGALRLNKSDDYPPPGECREYRLVSVEEGDEKNARIETLETKLKNAETYGVAMADDNRELREQLNAGDRAYLENERLLHLAIERLEAQLAERSPGVMPECVAKLVAATKDASTSWRQFEEASIAVEAYYAPPEGYEWQSVDDEHPITAEDVGRKVQHRNGGLDVVEDVTEIIGYPLFVGNEDFTLGGKLYDSSRSPFDITHILRPIAPPFVFAGEPGDYRTTYMGKTISVCACGGILVGVISGEYVTAVEKDGTFDGGRITGRVGE